MKKIECIAPSETFAIFQMSDGTHCCPVCGSAEFESPPYEEDGSPSFQMCSCGFEFGFDDSPFANSEAVEGVPANWKRWRRKVVEGASRDSTSLAKLMLQLENIRVRLAFDLIDIQDE